MAFSMTCNEILSMDSAQALKRLLSLKEKMEMDYDIQFATSPTPSEGFNIEVVSPISKSSAESSPLEKPGYECLLPADHLSHPEISLERLQILESRLAFQKLLVESGISRWPQKMSSQSPYVIQGRTKSGKAEFRWIGKRFKKYRFMVYVDDQFFTGEAQKFEAFVHNYKMYFRLSFFSHLDSQENLSLVAHELHHLMNQFRCLQYEDCSRQFGFSSSSLDLFHPDLMGPQTKEDLSSYSHYFSADEMEAYRLSGDFLTDPNKKMTHYQISQRMAQAQIFYLTNLLKKIKESEMSFFFNDEMKITLSFNQGEVSVFMPHLDFSSSEEAKKSYADLINERLRKVTNHMNVLERKIKRLQASLK